MIINIRPVDIAAAKASECPCPIVAAIWREHRKRVPCMAADWIWLDGLGNCELPQVAQKFMAAFDVGKEVKPIRFEIPLTKTIKKQSA